MVMRPDLFDQHTYTGTVSRCGIHFDGEPWHPWSPIRVQHTILLPGAGSEPICFTATGGVRAYAMGMLGNLYVTSAQDNLPAEHLGTYTHRMVTYAYSDGTGPAL